MRRLLLACVFFIVSCCATSAPPLDYAFGGRPLSPEGWYEELFNDARKCARKFGKDSGKNYDDIEWLIVPAGSMAHGNIVGLWSPPNRIYLDAGYVMNGDIVKHELLHHVLRDGDNDHESPVFLLCLGAK